MTQSKMTYRIFINVAPTVVFEYVSDLTRHGKWAGAPLRVEALTPGPIAVGHRYRSAGDDAFSKQVENQLAVTEYQPTTRFCFTAIDPRMGATAADQPFLHEFTFTSKDGGTLLERNVIREMPLLMAFMTKYVMGALVARPLMNRALQALKLRLENKEEE